MAELNFQKDVKIEIDALDLEWLRHPSKYMYYSEESAKASDRVRKLKHELEVVDAKIYQEVKIQSEGTGKKVTEEGAKSVILQDEKHLKALMDYNDALYEADLYASAVKAMDTKKTALQALVQLWSGSYFAGPKVPRNLKEEIKIEEQGRESEKERVRDKAERRIRKNNEEVN